VATFIQLKLKYLLDMEDVHPGLCYFYSILKPQIEVWTHHLTIFVLVWKKSAIAIAVGPFNHEENAQEEIMQLVKYT